MSARYAGARRRDLTLISKKPHYFMMDGVWWRMRYNGVLREWDVFCVKSPLRDPNTARALYA